MKFFLWDHCAQPIFFENTQADNFEPFCQACRLNRTIPDLDDSHKSMR